MTETEYFFGPGRFFSERIEQYVSPLELQRRERVAVGRICRCNDCFCCEERKNHDKAHLPAVR